MVPLEKVVGKLAAEIIGKTDSEYYGDEGIGQALRENDLRMMESGRNQTMEETVKTPDGLEDLSFEQITIPQHIRQYHRSTIGVSHRHHRPQKREEKLATSEKRLDQALRIADIGIWERNMQSGEVTWCDRMYRMFGEERATFVPTYESFLNHVHIEDRQKVQDTIQDAIARRASYEIEFRIITGAADTRAMLAHGEVILDPLGQPERITGTVLDLTTRKKIEEDLRKAHDELELRVQERTAQLSEAYETLAAEVQEREKTEERSVSPRRWKLLVPLQEALPMTSTTSSPPLSVLRR